MNKITKTVIEATFFVFFSTILIIGTATVIWILLGNN